MSSSKRKYTTVSIDADIFEKMYIQKAILLKGDKDKSWNNFFYKMHEIIEKYINGC